MYLEKIDIVGFKSFAKKTTLVFPEKEKDRGFDLTAIVGPNGSGKSNLLEAIRWALGEQGSRILRVKKSEDLIFSGGPRQPRANLTEVTLFFNNEEGGDEIPWREFSISRRLYRHEENEYLINNAPTRLQNILLILAQANFGQKSYSIISQGMIGNIIHLGPLDRQSFFEEATGVKGYQIKKEEALHKLEKTKNNLENALIALKEIEPRMRSLTRQIKRLERRQNLEEKLKEKQRKYYAILWQEISTMEESLMAKYRKTESKYLKAESGLKNLQARFSALFSETTADSLTAKQNEYKNLLKIKNQYLEEKSKIKETILLEEEKTKLGRLKEIKIDPLKVVATLNEIEKSIKNLLNQTEKITTLEEIIKIKEGLNQMLETIGSLKLAVKEPKIQIEKDNALQNLKIQFQNILKKLESHDQKINELEQKLAAETQEEKNKRNEALNLQREIEIKQNNFNQLREDLNEIKIEQTKVKTRSEALKEEIKQELNYRSEKKEIKSNFDELKTIKVMETKSVLETEIRRLKHELEFIGGIDPEIKKEYPVCRERYEFLSEGTGDLQKSMNSLTKITKELDQKINEQFGHSFAKINEQFDQYFKIFFRGGKAKLVLRKNSLFSQDNKISNENTEEGISEIEIIARPPKKQLKNIEALSGGESALTALALIFAIIAINKPPFVVLDEVDAALDEINSLNFAKILKELSLKTQFIIITHNLQTIEAAKFLYGITIDSQNISKLVSLKLEKN